METGKRTISLDLLVPLCEAMQTDINALLDTSDAEDDVVIRPVATPYHQGGTIWPLTRNREATGIVAVKMRLEPGDVDESVAGGVHPGHDWFFVLSGIVKLTLGAPGDPRARGGGGRVLDDDPASHLCTPWSRRAGVDLRP